MSISLIDMNGAFRSFEKSAVTDVRMENASLMPADYSKRLTATEIQNVVAYLKTLDGKDAARPGISAGVLSWDRLRNSAKELRTT